MTKILLSGCCGKMGRTVTNIGSICGIDPYAKKLRVGSRPSAYFALYDENNGKTWQRNYYLG